MQYINIFTKTRWLVTIILLTTLCIGNVSGADQTYTLVAQSALKDLLSTDKVLIVSSNGSSSYFALKNDQKTTAACLSETSVTINTTTNTITADLETDYTWNLEFKENKTISGSSYPTFYIKSTKGAYYLQNAGAKECLVTTKSSTDNLNVWAIGYQGSASIKVSGKTSTYYVTGLYNQGNSRMLAHQSSDWRCQASTVWNNLSGRVIQIYKLTPSCSDPVAPENGSFFLSHFFSTKICSVSFVSIVSFKN